jgi:hypothetical protein
MVNQAVLVREMLPPDTSVSQTIDGKAFKKPKKRGWPVELY